MDKTDIFAVSFWVVVIIVMIMAVCFGVKFTYNKTTSFVSSYKENKKIAAVEKTRQETLEKEKKKRVAENKAIAEKKRIAKRVERGTEEEWTEEQKKEYLRNYRVNGGYNQKEREWIVIASILAFFGGFGVVTRNPIACAIMILIGLIMSCWIWTF